MEGDAAAFAVFAFGAHPHQPGGGVDHQLGDGGLHGDHAGFQHRSDSAHQVGAGHGRVVVGLDHDHAEVGLAVNRRGDQVDGGVDAAARVGQQHGAQPVLFFLDELLALEHGVGARGDDAARDDPPDLALGVYADHGDDVFEVHAMPLRS